MSGHVLTGYALAALIVLHITAAFYHFLVRGDQVVERMATSGETRKGLTPRIGQAPLEFP
jgi:cytochrome b561